MRLAVLSSSALIAACATSSSPTADNTQPVDRACSVSECFQQRDVRDFEVIDNTTLIVYVGGQRCAFEVKLDGTFCDMTFAPEVYFRVPGGGAMDQRICSNDLRIGVDGGPFTESLGSSEPTDRFGTPRSQCRVVGVASITDDELVELYVKQGVVAPPPPIGPGQIEVDEEAQDDAQSAEQQATEGLSPDAESESGDLAPAETLPPAPNAVP